MVISKEYHKEYYIKNKDKIKERSKQFYIKNKEKYKKINKRYRELNPNKCKKWHIKYYKANIKTVKEKSKIWAKNNPDKVREQHKKWIKNNPDKVREQHKKWIKNNPDKIRKYNIKSLEKLGKLFNFNSTEYRYALKNWSRIIKNLDNYTCKNCNSIKNIQAHHIMPKNEFPKFSLDLNNGVTLCKNCHEKIHGFNTY